MGDATASRKEEESKPPNKIIHTCPFIKHSDMNEEMKVKTMKLCVTACETFANNNEGAAKMIKETMDKKHGTTWHVVVGENFGLEITYKRKNVMYMFFTRSLAVCVWKCT